MKTFSSLFPKAGESRGSDGKVWWRIRGSGVSGPPVEAPCTRAIIDYLERSGVAVKQWGVSGMVNADAYYVKARFLDGGLSAETGNYIGASKGAWLEGPKAALFVALGLGLRVEKKFLEAHELSGITLSDLQRELAAHPTPADS